MFVFAGEASPEARPSWDKLRTLLQAAIEGERGGEASAAAQVAKGRHPTVLDSILGGNKK